MPSARELLQQADALMRRNRARAVNTEIPELTEMIAMLAPVPIAVPVALDDVPELTDAVEEIEIASIVELPDDGDEASGWLHHDRGDWSVMGRGQDSIVARLPTANAPARDVERARSLLAIVGKPGAAADRIPAVVPALPAVEPAPPAIASAMPAVESAPSPAPGVPAADVVVPLATSQPAIADDWARWEVIAEEIRMQVLQRIDIFTDTRLRDQLSAQLQPIVDRASVEMVTTINEQVGKLLRAYIAEAIEREIEKWRGTAG